MSEEKVTKSILKRLIGYGWKIVCFDFPQSGTGYVLHVNEDLRTNKGLDDIIPDIVAYKDNTCLFFENKNRFYFPDFEKVNRLRKTNDYKESIDLLLKKYPVNTIYYGIGLPSDKYTSKNSEKNLELVDFILGVDKNNGSINAVYLCNDSIFRGMLN